MKAREEFLATLPLQLPSVVISQQVVGYHRALVDRLIIISLSSCIGGKFDNASTALLTTYKVWLVDISQSEISEAAAERSSVEVYTRTLDSF